MVLLISLKLLVRKRSVLRSALVVSRDPIFITISDRPPEQARICLIHSIRHGVDIFEVVHVADDNADFMPRSTQNTIV